MANVTLYHPKLDRDHDFPEESVEQWKLAGWQEKKKRKAPARLGEETMTAAASERHDAEEH